MLRRARAGWVACLWGVFSLRDGRGCGLGKLGVCRRVGARRAAERLGVSRAVGSRLAEWLGVRERRARWDGSDLRVGVFVLVRGLASLGPMSSLTRRLAGSSAFASARWAEWFGTCELRLGRGVVPEFVRSLRVIWLSRLCAKGLKSAFDEGFACGAHFPRKRCELV